MKKVRKERAKIRRVVSSTNTALLVIDVSRQRLHAWIDGRRVRVYRISTSRYGVSGRENSFCTPPGLHRVVRWIGAGRPPGAVFVSRRFTGEVLPRDLWRSRGERDLILTRILRLRGLEPGINAGPGCDSYSRFIYIHGTNHEQDIGRPVSRGCIRMANRDIIDLFNRTRGRRTFCAIAPTFKDQPISIMR